MANNVFSGLLSDPEVSKFPQFASPHVHPQSLDSASTPEAFAAREVALGSPALTCTDHGTLQASFAIYDLAKKNKLIPVIGLESYFRDDDDPILKRFGIPKTAAVPKGQDKAEWAAAHPEGSYLEYLKYMHLTLHFGDATAYSAGVRLLSAADARAEQHGSERKPLFGWAEIEELAALNVTAGSGCLIGMVQRHLLAHQDAEIAEVYFKRLHHLFKDRFYVEVFPHRCTHNWTEGVFISTVDAAGTADKQQHYFGKNLRIRKAGKETEVKAEFLDRAVHGGGFELIGIKNRTKWDLLESPLTITGVKKEQGFVQNECSPSVPDGDVQWAPNMFVAEMARTHGVKMLISDDAHFANPQEKLVQDIRLSQPGHSWKFHNCYNRMSSDDAWPYFRDRMGVPESEFRGWIDNSVEWADSLKGFKFDSSPKLPTQFYPEDTLGAVGEMIQKYGRLREDSVPHMERLEREIDLIHRNGKIDLLSYFMIDEEVVRFYRNQGWLTGPGRGSAAGVLTSYLLGITHIDSLRYSLSLERFLTPDRVASGKMPDIDQDLPFREPLEGWEVDVVEFMAAIDGTTHIVPVILKLETPDGSLVTAEDAAKYGWEISKWWDFADHSGTTIEITRDSRIPGSDLPRWFPGWFKERFGEYIAQISVDSTMKLRAAVKDVMRSRHGFVSPRVEDLCKQFEQAPVGVTDAHFVLGWVSPDEGEIPGSIETDTALQAFAAENPEDFEIVKMALGLARHRSRHPCASVLADRPIHTFIPLTTIGGLKVTSFTAPAVEAVGGLKMDFLGVNTIHDIHEALVMIRERHGLIGSPSGTFAHHLIPLPDRSGNADIWDLPEDPAVFADFAAGRTETVFQYWTPAAVDWLRHFNQKRADGRPMIASIMDLAIFTALDRPGPLNVPLRDPKDLAKTHNALVEYTRRAAGLPGTPDIHPAVSKLLPETHGVIIFQEQVQEIYQQITGCTGPEAEEFRRKVAKKEDEKLKANKPIFMERATAILGSVEDAEGVWAMLRAFAQYGFNRSHAVSYAVIGYACAYLKRHYRLEWWCAILRHADKDKINKKLWADIGSSVALPDVGVSGATWEIRGDRIQAPADLLTGIGPTAHAQLMKYGPYKTIQDVAEGIQKCREDGRTESTDEETGKKKVKMGRSALNRGIVRNLIIAGVMDSLFPPGTAEDEKIAAFDAEMLIKVGKSYAAVVKKADDPTLDSLGRYQTIKAVLAPYGADVRGILPGILPSFLERQGERLVYNWRKWDREEEREVDASDTVISWDQLAPLVDATEVPEFGFRTAVVGYVEDIRPFKWGPGKTSDGLELIFEVGGGKLALTKWPKGQDGAISDEERAGLAKGSVIAAVITRTRADKPFSIRDCGVIRGPLKGQKENSDGNTEDKKD